MPTPEFHVNNISWAGPFRSHGPPPGPASPSPGSRAISVVRRKPGAKVASRVAFPLPTMSLHLQPVRASVLSRKTIHIFSPGPEKNKKSRHLQRLQLRICSKALYIPFILHLVMLSNPLDASYDRIVAYSHIHAFSNV